jgi:RNA polymerase sigma factor (sigma-70 family)
MAFPTTRWTVIAQLASSEGREGALSFLCRAYWGPVYAFVRKLGRNHEDAEDLTQGFFGHIFQHGVFDRAEKTSGRLRSYLLASLENFVAMDHRAEVTQKRGGGVRMIPLFDAEALMELERLGEEARSPREAFDRAWVVSVLRNVLERLRTQYREAGRELEFDAILPWLLDADSISQEEAAKKIGASLTSFRVQLHRLRLRYRDALRDEMANTTGADDLETELGHFISIFGHPA